MSRQTALALYGVLIVASGGMIIGAVLSQWIPVWYVAGVAVVLAIGSLVSGTVLGSKKGKR